MVPICHKHSYEAILALLACIDDAFNVCPYDA